MSEVSGQQELRKPLPKRLARVLLVVASLAVGVAGCGYVATRMLFNEENIRRQAEEALGRPVAYAEIDPGFFSISVHDLEIGDVAGFTPDPLLKLGELELRFSWGDLLRGEVAFDEIILRDGALQLEFDTGWNSNIADLLAPSDAEPAFKIETVSFENFTLGLRSPGGDRAVGLQGFVTGLGTAEYQATLRATLGDGTGIIQGRCTPEPLRGTIDLTCDRVPLSLFSIPEDILASDGLLLSGPIAVAYNGETVTVSGTPSIAGLGELSFDLAAFAATSADSDSPGWLLAGDAGIQTTAENAKRLALLRETLTAIDARGGISVSTSLYAPFSDLPINVTGTFQNCSLVVPGVNGRLSALNGPFTATARLFAVGQSRFTVAGVPFRGAGRIRYAPATIDFSVMSDTVDMKRLAVVPAPAPLPSGLTVEGPGSASVTIAGPLTDPVVTGLVLLAGCQLNNQDPVAVIRDVIGGVAIMPDRYITEVSCGAASFAEPPAAAAPPARENSLFAGLGRITGVTYLMSGIHSLFAIKDRELLYNYDHGSIQVVIIGDDLLLQRLNLRNAKLNVFAAGRVDIADETLDLDCKLLTGDKGIFGDAGRAAIRLISAATLQDTVTVIPFTVKGTFAEPAFALKKNEAATLRDVVNAPVEIIESVGGFIGSVGRRFGLGRDTAAAVPDSTPAAGPAPSETPPAPAVSTGSDTPARRPRIFDIFLPSGEDR